jgi:ribonuclease P protein component
VGFVVPKYKHSGVARNRVKRRLREIARLKLLGALAARAAPLDLVIRAFPSAYARDYAALEAELLQVLRRLS